MTNRLRPRPDIRRRSLPGQDRGLAAVPGHRPQHRHEPAPARRMREHRPRHRVPVPAPGSRPGTSGRLTGIDQKGGGAYAATLPMTLVHGQIPFDIEGRPARQIMRLLWFAANHILTMKTPLGRKMRAKVRGHGGRGRPAGPAARTHPSPPRRRHRPAAGRAHPDRAQSPPRSARLSQRLPRVCATVSMMVAQMPQDAASQQTLVPHSDGSPSSGVTFSVHAE
jgi:hypothetical protein